MTSSFDLNTRTRRSRVAARSPALCVLVNGTPASVPAFDFTLVGRLTRGHPANDSGDQIADVHKPVVAPLSASVVAPVRHAETYREEGAVTSEQDGKELAVNGNEQPTHYGLRAGYALERCVPGPNRNKKIETIFNCSPRMARYLRAGLYWSIERLNIASTKIKKFDAYLASPDFQTRFDELERELAELREDIRGGDRDE